MATRGSCFSRSQHRLCEPVDAGTKMGRAANAVKERVAEFDSFASGYQAGMENPVKRLLAESADDFARHKAGWLLRLLESNRALQAGDGENHQLLDLGCGDGLLLKHLKLLGYPGMLRGCDLSEGMLTEAVKHLDGEGSVPLDLVTSDELPYQDGTFRFVVLSSVLHHVVPEHRSELLAEAARVLMPAGRLCVLEHNPWNPITQWVIAHTSIDRNAVLLTPNETKLRLRAAGLTVEALRYLLFVPPRWRIVSLVDNCLGWLPLGGQYAVIARKVEPSH